MGRTRNRRIHDRLRINVPARLTILSIPGYNQSPRSKLSCTTCDVSRSGIRICLIIDYTVAIGSIVKIKMAFSRFFHRFTLTGTVRWSRREAGTRTCFIGVEITHTPERTLDAWIAYLDKLFRNQRKQK
jgi:hypothetical protein